MRGTFDMNIHEYQAKQLLAQYGVSVPPGEVCSTAEEAKAIAEKLFAKGEKVVVVKSQIHAGGRGKGTFKSGFQGGVKLCKSVDDVFEKAKAMLGNVLVTKQTGPEGRLVKKLLDAAVGMMPYQARKLARALGLQGDLISSGAKLLMGVYKTWWECDASMVEINPLC